MQFEIQAVICEFRRRNLFDGIGKPEPWKATLSGWWSRRINDADRMVYRENSTSLCLLFLQYFRQELSGGRLRVFRYLLGGAFGDKLSAFDELF
ncbi:MAG: type II toxin-antitoxin system YoeB family toxin [Victivallales bacterium]